MTPVLRIAHVIRSLDGRAGGPPVVCTRLASAQVSRGHAVSVVTEAVGDAGAVAGIESRVVPPVGLGELLTGGPARRLLAGWCAGADVLHLHGVWDPLLLVAGSEAVRAGTPYVVVPHGMLDPWSLAQRRWKKRLGLAVGTRRLLDRAAVLHLLNADEADLLGPLGLKAPAAVVPNGVALVEIDPLPDPSEFRRARPELGSRPYVLFLGRLHFKKGLDILADAFAGLVPKFPDLRLVVAGADDGERANFEARVRDHRLGDRVHLVGPLYGRAKWAALAGAACFCLPSRQEGFSIAVLEALACRRPVVISEDCHFPEVAEVGAGVVVALNASAVAAGVAQVLIDPIATAMGAAGRRLVEAKYTWDRVAEQCEAMYAAAGAGRAGRHGAS